MAHDELAGGDVGEERGQPCAHAGREHAQLEGVDDGALGRAVEEGERPVREGEVLPGERLGPRAGERGLGEDAVGEEHRAGEDGEAAEKSGIAPAAEGDLPPLRALTADRRVAATAEELLLHEEEQSRREEQRHREGGRHLHLGRVLEQRPHLGGDGVKARGQGEDGGRAEEGEGLEHGEDEAAQDGGQHHGQGDGERHLQAIGAEDRRGFLEVGGDEPQGVGDHDVHVGEGVDGDHEDEAGHGEDVQERILGAGEAPVELVEVSGVGAGEHHPREGAQEGRRHEGGHDEAPYRARPRQVGAGGQPGHGGADGHRGEPRPEGEHQRVPECLLHSRIGEDARVVAEGEAALAAHAHVAEPAQGQQDEQGERGGREHPHGRGAIEPFPPRGQP